MMISVKIHSFLLSLLIISIHGKLTSVIETDKGPVQGEILKTVYKSVPYSSFRGIPYGKPPIGNLRFKPPEEVIPWNKTLLATSEGNHCPQVDFIHKKYSGNEDCLNINVYTPKINFNDKYEKLMPVIVWITGGKFKFGYAIRSFYGPDFLLEEKVVMVAVNFRLGALGLLALNIPEATGNAELKDQTLALKWVKKNIIKFGGNPNSVTLFGISTGAASVDLHLLSKASRGLFHRSISMSGTPLNPWGFSTPEQAEARALRLADLLGIETTNVSKREIFKELFKKSAEELVMATENVTKADRPFKPTIEDPEVAGEKAFLTECPFWKFKNGEFPHIPHIMGFVANESVAFATSTKDLIHYTEFMLDNMKEVLQNRIGKDLLFFKERLSNNSDSVLADFPESFLIHGLNLLTDVLTLTGIDTKQRLMAAYPSAPVYYYRDSFDAGANSLHRIRYHVDLNGTAHADDLTNIFYISLFNSSLDSNDLSTIVRQRTVRMFANFAKYGNPTPNGSSDPLLNITWPVSGKQGIHLEIGKTLTIGERPIDSDVKILENAQKGGVLEKLNGCVKKIC